MDEKRKIMLGSFFIRTGLATVFLYAAVSSFLQPDAWVGFFPFWLQNIIPGKILLSLFAIFQIGLALWLLTGKRMFEAGIVSAITLLAILIFNLGALDIVFRDVAILLSALALVALEHARRRKNRGKRV